LQFRVADYPIQSLFLCFIIHFTSPFPKVFPPDTDGLSYGFRSQC
jgi:hypothetical protein